MTKIILASNNTGKLKEFRALFAPLSIDLIPQSDYQVPDCPEPYATFVENALAKARHASKYTNLPALADDSGICASALQGAPGIHSARYAGSNPKSDSANNHKLSEALSKQDNLSVYYVCVLVLVRHEKDPQPLIAEGIMHGIWQFEAKGDHGFGYDPHFFLPQYNQTIAEISPELKNQISHRAQAWQALLTKLQNSPL